MAQRSIELGSFAPGLNNRLEPTQLAKKQDDGSMGQYLYGASNVDLNERGYLKRRAGLTTQLAGRAHSLWADHQGAYVVIAGQLCAYAPPTALTPIYAGIAARVSYSRGADNDVYWSDGVVLRRITQGVDAAVATPVPNPAPSYMVGGGALPAGTYLLAVTVVSADGESPATPVVAVTVPAGSAITVMATQAVHVYMSAPDGDILTLQGVGATYTVFAYTESATRCLTLNRAVMPAGQIVRHYRGCLLVASGNTLYISDPYNYGVYNPSKSYIPFSEDINLVEPVENGVYIAADRTFWIGNLLEDALQEIYPHGAVLGTSGHTPHDENVFWQSQHGLIIADNNMSFKNVQEDALRFPTASEGASIYRERDGMTHVVTTRLNVNTSVAAAYSFMEAEIIRKGTIL